MSFLRKGAESVFGSAAVATINFVYERTEKAQYEIENTPLLSYDALPTPTSIRLLRLEPTELLKREQAREACYGEAKKSSKDKDGQADDDEVRFIMRTVELDRLPRYTALSYTWRKQRSYASAFFAHEYDKGYAEGENPEIGPQYKQVDMDNELIASRKVFCNGNAMMIFDNLYEALKQLRRSRPGEWLWIDAICINQRDDVEKAAQIQIMGRIYTTAQLVVVWLGTVGRIAAEGVRNLETLVQSGDPLPPNPWYSLPRTGDVRSDWRLATAATTAFHLSHRSYFRRVWVVQELCLARSVVFLHGKYTISLDALLASCEWCIDREFGRDYIWSRHIRKSFGPNFNTHMRFVSTTLQTSAGLAASNGGRSDWTLLQWFQACSGRSAGVAKDYVFAGLSLVSQDRLSIDKDLIAISQPPPLPPRPGTKVTPSDAAEAGDMNPLSINDNLLPNGLWPALYPHYQASDGEVLVNAAACLLSHSSSAEDLLRIASRLRDKHQYRDSAEILSFERDAVSTLPSWVPALGSWTSGLARDFMVMGSEVHFAACPLSTAEAFRPSISGDGRILSIQGGVLDQIGPSQVELDEDGTFGIRELRQLIRFLTITPDFHSTASDDPESKGPAQSPCLFDQVACAMVAGHIEDQPITPADAGHLLCESIESRVRFFIADAPHEIKEYEKDQKWAERNNRVFGDPLEQLSTAADDENAEMWRRSMAMQKEYRDAMDHVFGELEVLKARWPNQPWPGEKADAVQAKDEYQAEALQRREKRREESLHREDSSSSTGSFPGLQTAMDRVKLGIKETRQSLYDRSVFWSSGGMTPFTRPRSPKCRAFERTCKTICAWRKICISSQRGLVCLGPRWLQEGDSLMLLPGASTPFFFAHEGDDLKREEGRILERLSHIGEGGVKDATWSAIKPELDERLSEVRESLRQIEHNRLDRWVLVGQAYSTGIMEGEAAAHVDFKPIEVV